MNQTSRFKQVQTKPGSSKANFEEAVASNDSVDEAPVLQGPHVGASRLAVPG